MVLLSDVMGHSRFAAVAKVASLRVHFNDRVCRTSCLALSCLVVSCPLLGSARVHGTYFVSWIFSDAVPYALPSAHFQLLFFSM